MEEHMRNRISQRTALFATMVAGGLAFGTANAAADTLSKGDRDFVQKAAQGGVSEVEMGKLAQQKAENQQVKDFGARMVQDHTKANDELKKIASAKSVNIPDQPDKQAQKEMDKLQKLSGAQFDREYMTHMVSDHKKDVSEFQKAAKSAKDSEVKNFAATTLPTLQEHLKMAQNAERTTKSNTASKSK
jgi:putative membrane protein